MTRVRVQAVHPDGTLVSHPAILRGVDVMADWEKLAAAAEEVFKNMRSRVPACEWTIRPDHYEAT